MSKEFVSFETVRNNSLKLAHTIHEGGFEPDVVYVSLRGGAYVGNVMSEYFKVVRRGSRPVFYAAVVARSYSDIREQDLVMVDGWTYSPEYLRSGDKVLLIDDIFDSGNTINHLVDIILRKGLPRDDVRVAVHDYKVRTYLPDDHPVHPDYYCRKHVIERPEDDHWIHYMSHELVGLAKQEISENYTEDAEVSEILRSILE
jgi:uncharacterized protein